MKKFLLSILAIFAFTLSACEQAEDIVDEGKDIIDNEDETDKATYKDGTYSKEGEPWTYGKESVEITIENGDITSVVLRRLTLDGEEIDYTDWTGEEINGKTYPNLKQFRIDMAQEIIEEQSTEGVDAIAGATITTQNWIDLVNQILEEAKVTEG